MLTTDDIPTVGTYSFKSSPSSSGDVMDYFDVHPKEDFLQTLSSDLDIPLLLNPNEDEMGILNSFLDKSPDEILSEFTPPGPGSSYSSIGNELEELQSIDFTQWGPEAFPNLKAEPKQEPDLHSSVSVKSESPTPSHGSNSPPNDVKEDFFMDTPPVSPNDNLFLNVRVTSPNRNTVKQQQRKVFPVILPQNVEIKNEKVPIPHSIPKNKKKMFLVQDEVPAKQAKISNAPNVITYDKNVVVLENVKTVPIATTVPQMISNINGMNACIAMPIVVNKTESLPINISTSIDPKALKRQQRMIKNRESANLSRKKKKEYLTSLERQVIDLTNENQRLKLENMQLKEKLSKQNGIAKLPIVTMGLPTKTVTKTMVLCAFLFTVGVNLDYFSSSIQGKNSLSKSTPDSLIHISDHHGRSLLWSPETDDNSNTTNSGPSLPVCPVYVNQSENVRLALELHKWIGKPYNMSEDLHNFNVLRPARKSRAKARSNSLSSTPVLSSVYRMGKKFRRLQTVSNNELQVFTPNVERIYSEFFEAINRRDDTFYVVSFSADHMLLPALHYNKTTRPKMSLIMPSVLPNNSTRSQPTLVPLMQIDCEVLDTRLIHIKYRDIPQHLRTNGNQTNRDNPDNNPGRNYTSKPYKPYFMRNGRPKSKPLYFDDVKSELESIH